MHENTPPKDAADARATARTNLFMAATLHTDGVAYPVTIRDLSATGAQVEVSVAPSVGSGMTLSRGRLSVPGHVAWCTDRRCGLHFTSQISVQDWMASPVHRQQQRVDSAVAVVKSGVMPLERAAELQVATPAQAAQDLKRVSCLLEILSDALASDPAVVVKHGMQLQNLDIALQTLTALAGTMQAGDPEYAANIARLTELRISCAEALQAKS